MTMSARWNSSVKSGTSWIALSENANKLNHFLQTHTFDPKASEHNTRPKQGQASAGFGSGTVWILLLRILAAMTLIPINGAAKGRQLQRLSEGLYLGYLGRVLQGDSVSKLEH